MNKAELIAAMAKSANLSKTASERALNGMIEAVTESLSGGDTVTLVGFGTFSAADRAARVGRNPQTGQTIQIEAKRVAKFKAGKFLAEAMMK